MKRATRIAELKVSAKANFNPRPREEGDKKGWVYQRIYNISIHALVKRATSNTRPVSAGRGHFNPRPREEGDLKTQRQP